MIEKPVVSPAFTIEDIHKIREYHSELTKNMSIQEFCDFYNKDAELFMKEREEKRRRANRI